MAESPLVWTVNVRERSGGRGYLNDPSRTTDDGDLLDRTELAHDLS